MGNDGKKFRFCSTPEEQKYWCFRLMRLIQSPPTKVDENSVRQ